jgi:hypothetical protein
MYRCQSQGFRCGVGGDRKRLEQRIGRRMNMLRINEPLAL